MFGLTKHGPSSRYGVVVDIASAGATAAIVVSDPQSESPVIVWSYREEVVLKETFEKTFLVNSVRAAIMNVFLEIGTQGIKVLRNYDREAKISECRVSVSAPWSHLVTQKVHSKNEKEFVVNRTLINNLEAEAEARAEELIKKNDFLAQAGIVITNNITLGTQVNGYYTKAPLNQKAKEITLNRLLSVIAENINEVIVEAHNKILPGSELVVKTSIFQLHFLTSTIFPHIEEYCLVNFRGEAIEIGIVRDGVLSYVTHRPIGYYSLARNIAVDTNNTFSDVLSSIQHDFIGYVKELGAEKQKKVAAIYEDFISQTVELFRETGDLLSIPKTIIYHYGSGFGNFAEVALQETADNTTGLKHTLIDLGSKIANKGESKESSIIVAANVFHKHTIV